MNVIKCMVMRLRHPDGILVSVQSSGNIPAYQELDWQHRESNYLYKNHLYFSSLTEPINDGDWIMTNPQTQPQKYIQSEDTLGVLDNHVLRTTLKVMASTNPEHGLPAIPDNFMKEYIKENGKISEVELQTVSSLKTTGYHSEDKLVQTMLKIENNEVVVNLEWQTPSHPTDEQVDIAIKSIKQGLKSRLHNTVYSEREFPLSAVHEIAKNESINFANWLKDTILKDLRDDWNIGGDMWNTTDQLYEKFSKRNETK